MILRKLVRRVVWKERASSDTYIAHLRKIGVLVGEDVTIYVPSKTVIDEQYPWMIQIGDHVRITQGVIILTHDYSWSVLKGMPSGTGGGILGASGKVVIGNNVSIGMNAVITRGVKIGNNVIIGAGSVVTKDCQEGGVYAGNPAKRIEEIGTFYEKRKREQLREARELAVQYSDRYGKRPDPGIFHEYFMLFEDASSVQEKSWCVRKLKLGGNYQQSIAYLRNNKPLFQNYEEFLRYCLDNGEISKKPDGEESI